MITDRASSNARPSLEARIGARWLLYTGVVALVVGASSFVTLAIDNQWITPAGQVLTSAAAGLAFVVAGTHFVRLGYARYGQAVAGGGLAVLYVSTYGAFSFYHLVPWTAACAVMVATTAAGACLADAHRSQGLALMAVGGGFVTPFLLGPSTNAPIPLFTYDAILVGGTMYLARQRRWPLLNLLSYLSTVLTLATWAARFYTPGTFVSLEIYLTLFCVMFLDIVRHSRDTTTRFGRIVRVALCSAPVVFYLASLAILEAHDVLFVSFLLVFSASGVVLTRSAPASRLRLVLWGAIQPPLFGWINGHTGDLSWLIVGLIAVASTYAIYLTAQLTSIAPRGVSFGNADRTLLHLNGLAAAVGTYLVIDAVRSDLAGLVTAIWAAWQLSVALALSRRQRPLALHVAALAGTLLVVAAVVQVHGLVVVIGSIAEGAVVMWLGLHERNEWLRRSGAWLFAIPTVWLLGAQWSPGPFDQLVFRNQRAAGLFAIGLTYVLAWRHHREPGNSDRRHDVAVLLALGSVLTLTWLTSEITAGWPWPRGSACQLTLSLTWVAYATILTAVGLRTQYAPIRYVAIVGFCLTTVKVFLVDLAELDPSYRVLSVAGLGIALLTASYLYAQSRTDPSTA